MQFHGSAAQRRGLFSSSNIYTDSCIRTVLVYGAASVLCFVFGAATALLGGLASLLVPVTLLLGLVVLANYRIGVWIAVLMLPFSATQIFPRQLFGIVGLNPLNVLLVATVLSFFFAWVFRQSEHTVPKFPLLFWLLVLLMVLAGLYGSQHVAQIPTNYRIIKLVNFNTAGGYLLDEMLKPIIIVAVAVLVAIVARNAKRPTAFVVPLFLSAVLLALVVLVYVAISGIGLGTLASSRSREFLSWMGIHANELGLLFNTAFALALFSCASSTRFRVRLAMMVVIVLTTVSVALTFSRGAFLGYVLVVGVFLVTRRRFRTVLVGLVVSALVVVIMPQEIVERAITGIERGDLGQISAGRVDNIWRPLLPSVLEKPLFGHGLSSTLWSEAARRGTMLPTGHPHSAYLGLLLDFGIVGAIVIALFYLRLWQLFRRLKVECPDPFWRGFFEGASVCILILLVQGVTDDRFTPTFPQCFMWMSAGLAFGFSDRFSFSSTEKVARSD